jgi:hypothetical protein
MRHIPLRDQEPDTAWLAKANKRNLIVPLTITKEKRKWR